LAIFSCFLDFFEVLFMFLLEILVKLNTKEELLKGEDLS